MILEILDRIADEINTGNLGGALEIIEENAASLEDNAEFWNLKGLLCVKAGEIDTAEACLEKAVSIERNNVDVLYNLAYIYEIKEQYLKALKTYRTALIFTDNDGLKDDIRSSIKRIEDASGADKGYCETIVKNTDSKTAPQPGDDIYTARRNVAEAMLDDDAPLVSIIVLAYNNLEKYTKTCVECILKYTVDIDYELILVDNGSSDGTFEYFESVQHSKKVIIRVTKNIGSGYGSLMGIDCINGKYMAFIPNDVYVTKDWLSNMLKCVISDKSIGMVNPVCDNISNFQNVDLKYTNFEDMQIKAAGHNISDPRKWEERIRLISLGTLFKKECLDIIGLNDYGFFHDFGDDDMTFRVRRAGYKAILCRDVFLSHAGETSDKGVDIARMSLEKGKRTFRDKYYGIDAWEDVNNFESTMMSFVEPKYKEDKIVEILGIDVLCGTPILELKNTLRNKGVFNIKLSAFCREPKYWIDLKTICGGKVQVDRSEYILEHFGHEKFDYIILGEPINTYREPYKFVEDMLSLLNNDGQLLIKLYNTYSAKTLFSILGKRITNEYMTVHQIPVEYLNEHLGKSGYYIKNILPENYDINDNGKKLLKNAVLNMSDASNVDNILNKIMVRNYVINVAKI